MAVQAEKAPVRRCKNRSDSLCDWEKGRSEPDVSSLVALADFFGVSVDYLVGRTDSYPDGTEAFDAEM